jgi:hypothetical protein
MATVCLYAHVSIVNVEIAKIATIVGLCFPACGLLPIACLWCGMVVFNCKESDSLTRVSDKTRGYRSTSFAINEGFLSCIHTRG